MVSGDNESPVELIQRINISTDAIARSFVLPYKPTGIASSTTDVLNMK